METITKIIKEHGEYEAGIYYPASQQLHPLPELLASGERIGISFLIEVDGIQFFAEENPGNINGAFYHVYFDGPVLPMSTTRKVRSIIKNNQDAIGINLRNVNFTVN